MESQDGLCYMEIFIFIYLESLREKFLRFSCGIFTEYISGNAGNFTIPICGLAYHNDRAV
jgi:hypothetical protein